MKNIVSLLALIALIAMGCQKSDTYMAPQFPGYSGKGDAAAWTPSRHTITDAAYLNTVLPTLNPATTLKLFDSSLVAARQKEVSPFAIKLYKSGEVAITSKNAQNQWTWLKQGLLKWEAQGDFMYIYLNQNGSWVKLAECYADLDKLVCKYTRAYFNDLTADKGKFFMDVIYSLYQFP